MADPNFIPDSDFVPDAQSASPVASNVGASAPYFVPDDQFVSDEDLANQRAEAKSAKYGTFPQMGLTALESAASTLTGGLSRGAETYIGDFLGTDQLAPEAQKAREEENPISRYAGTAGGFALGATTAAGLAKFPILGAVPRAIGQLGTAGVEALGLGEATGLGGAALKAAVKNGIEGALLQGEDEVGKMVTGDPSQTLGTAAISTGLSGLIGGGIGGALGGAGELWSSKFGSKAASALEAGNDALEGSKTELPNDYLQQRAVANGVLDLKPNANEIAESSSRLGIKPTAGMLSGNEFVQNIEGNLSRRPSIAGTAAAKENQGIFDNLSKAAQSTLRDATEQTQAQVGKQIKEGIADKLSEELEPIEKEYERLKPVFKEMPVSEDLRNTAASSVLNDEIAQVAPNSKSAKLANQLGDEISGLDNVDKIKTYRSLINRRLNEAVRAGSEEVPVLMKAKNALTDLRESAINQAAALPEGVEGPVPDYVNDIRNVDSNYRSYKEGLKGLGVEAGLGNLNDARSLLDRFSKISDENFAKRLFDTNDINSINFFKENFPEQYDLARRYKLAEIQDASIDHVQGKNGQFSVGKFLSQVRKLGPEARDALFNGTHAEKISDIEKVFQAVPGNPNPSGTSYATAFSHLLSFEGGIQNLTDAAQYALLKGLPHFGEAAKLVGGDEAAGLAALKAAASADKAANPQGFQAMTNYIRSTIKGENALSKGINSIFDNAGATLAPSLIPSDKDIEKLDKKLRTAQGGEDVFSSGSSLDHYLPDHAAEAVKTAGTAVNYLNSLRPKQVKANPLDEEPEVPQGAKSAFTRNLQIAEQPLMALEHIKKGTLIPQDVAILQNIYPGLYSRITAKLYSGIMSDPEASKNLPYNTKISMSLFLGKPLDSSMTPTGIQAAQPIVPQGPQNQERQGIPTKGPHSMKNITNLASAYATPQQAREAQKLKI